MSNDQILSTNDLKSQKDQNMNVGKWTNQQNLKYAIFMDFHKVTLSSRSKKKNFKVFQQMVKFIGSRNAIQCRSHHQKLQERFKDFKKIICVLKNQTGRKEYKLHFNKWSNSGQGLICSEPEMKGNIQEEIRSESQRNITEYRQQQMVFTPTVLPFYASPDFLNMFAFAMPSIYQFGCQFYG